MQIRPAKCASIRRHPPAFLPTRLWQKSPKSPSRAGLTTSAAMAGASERSIQEQTGHKSLPVLRRYIRDGSLFRENAAAQVGL